MTKQCSEIVFGKLKMIKRQMLDNNSEKGKYGQPNNLDCNILTQTKTLATTTAECKQDFRMLERLMRLKPKTLDLAYDGNILYIKNKTNEWREKLKSQRN